MLTCTLLLFEIQFRLITVFLTGMNSRLVDDKPPELGSYPLVVKLVVLFSDAVSSHVLSAC